MFGTRLASLLVLALVLVGAAGPTPVQDPGELPLVLGRIPPGDDFYEGLARGLTGVVPAWGGAEELLLADVSPRGGFGDDATLRAYVARFLTETSPRNLCVLAHHLRTQTTRRWGTVWTIDAGPLALLAGCADDDPNPVRRAFALVALQDWHGFRAARYLGDEDALVRLAAARVLDAPEGVNEADALKVIEPLLGLLADERPACRAAAAGALGPWIFRAEDLARLTAAAESDPDPGVRSAALTSLGAVRSLSAREHLRGVTHAEASSAAEREAARRGLARTGITL